MIILQLYFFCNFFKNIWQLIVSFACEPTQEISTEALIECIADSFRLVTLLNGPSSRAENPYNSLIYVLL